ncbi:MAG TPA: hypothetical protein VJT49_08195 [Amycolatopsis sp.]|uniref:SCO6745 family protein n=1 Tax=Amycolatopsis sp. TaxID=37632 RepID=UPI002B4933C0|nr:hypothetical protein [Amycolatopsis sp.]HKS45083.1 hypothetical protein [Amycolatopsis sp.]
MSSIETAREMRPIVQVWGGKFMTSPELAEVESERGVGRRALYLRGRSAVLGDPPPAVVAELFGIFPRWLSDLVIPAATRAITADAAVEAYVEALERWAKAHLAGIERPERLAELLLALVQKADASGLALFAGWQRVPPPADALARVGFGLMVLREYRGGLHFAALRAVGVTVPEAVVADPEGGRTRLLRTAWSPEQADELVARAQANVDLLDRWRRAEDLTDERVAELLEAALSAEERAELLDLLRKLEPTMTGSRTSGVPRPPVVREE